MVCSWFIFLATLITFIVVYGQDDYSTSHNLVGPKMEIKIFLILPLHGVTPMSLSMGGVYTSWNPRIVSLFFCVHSGKLYN